VTELNNLKIAQNLTVAPRLFAMRCLQSAAALLALSGGGNPAEAGTPNLDIPPTIGYFSYDPGRGEDRIAIGFGPMRLGSSDAGEWFMLGKAPSGTRPTTLRWATTKTCSTARDLTASLRRFPMPQATLPSTGVDDRRPGDPVYILETQAEFLGGGRGELRLTAGEGTQLALWIKNAFASLEKCWTDKDPSEQTGDQ